MHIDLTNIEEVARAKEEFRRRRAALPIEEKIRILVEMQKRRAPIVKLRGKVQRVWEIQESKDDHEGR
jgi:hypothetical protein